MTLVVAHKIGDDIRIVSDTKVTGRTNERFGPIQGVLKAVVLSKSLCVCYAGSVARAEAAIRELGRCDLDQFGTSEVLARLERVCVDGKGDTDFVVASRAPTRSLHRVCQAKVEHDLDSCWIGNQEAFFDFQSSYSAQERADDSMVPEDEREGLHEISAMDRAMQSVIRSQVHQDVGDHLVHITSEPTGFRYLERVELTLGAPQADGGFRYSVLTPRVPGVGALGAYYYQGNFGVLFYPSHSSSGEVFHDVSVEAFIREVRQKHGFEIGGMQLNK